MRDNEELMNTFRIELKRAVQQRFKRIDLDRFKAELKDHVTHFLFEHTGGSPIVIPVVNVIGGGKPQSSNSQPANSAPKSGNKPSPENQSPEPSTPTPEQRAAEQQKRFEEMRSRLLGQDARTD